MTEREYERAVMASLFCDGEERKQAVEKRKQYEADNPEPPSIVVSAYELQQMREDRASQPK